MNDNIVNKTIYGIAFDMVQAKLDEHYHVKSTGNAYNDIAEVLIARGFYRQQKSMYFGNDGISAVECVLVVQELSKTFPWFAPSVGDIRMLRIEDNNDLKPAIDWIMANSGADN